MCVRAYLPEGHDGEEAEEADDEEEADHPAQAWVLDVVRVPSLPRLLADPLAHREHVAAESSCRIN